MLRRRSGHEFGSMLCFFILWNYHGWSPWSHFCDYRRFGVCVSDECFHSNHAYRCCGRLRACISSVRFFTFEWFFWFKYLSEEERSRSLNKRRLRWLSTHTHSEVDDDYTFDAQIRPNSNQPRPVGCCNLTPRFIFWTLWSAGWFILFWSLYILEIPSFHWLGVDYWGTEGFVVLIAWLCYMPRFLSYCNESNPWCCIRRTCLFGLFQVLL